jgi:hypothetical protein
MKLKTVIAALALAAIGLFAGAPYYTAHQIRQAVQNGDAAALARHVDFERVRASLKRQLADGVARQLPDSARTGFMADLGAMLAGRAADVALLGGRMGNPFDNSPPEAGAEGAGNPPAAPAESRRISARYVGWDRFQVDLPAKGRTVNLMLSREGLLNWKLTGIDLSDLL